MNGRLWGGLLLSVVATFSYFFFFYRFPITRDVPWVNYILFAAATALLISGFRRARRKVWAGVGVAAGILLFIGFVFGMTIGARVPLSPSAPRVGQKAPDFALLDSTRHQVSLDQLLASSPHGVLLVFYRGYW
jgi:energy-coupling factor transporter transmembrane protein EcfT